MTLVVLEDFCQICIRKTILKTLLGVKINITELRNMVVQLPSRKMI